MEYASMDTTGVPCIKVVRIYTENWTPYLGLEIHNHKESPEIIVEMAKATGISAQALMAPSVLGWTTYAKSFVLPLHDRQHGSMIQPTHCSGYSLYPYQFYMVKETRHWLNSWHSCSRVRETPASLHGLGNQGVSTVAFHLVSSCSTSHQLPTFHMPFPMPRWERSLLNCAPLY